MIAGLRFAYPQGLSSTSKKLSKKFRLVLAMAEQDVITPLTSGAASFSGA
jgi:hypothetical protein